MLRVIHVFKLTKFALHISDTSHYIGPSLGWRNISDGPGERAKAKVTVAKKNKRTEKERRQVKV